MEIITLSVGELQTNCYLVFCPKTRECIIIDPGDEANFISEKIIYENLTPLAIIATHGHFDHLLAANELQMAFNIPVLIHKNDCKILENIRKSASWWLKKEVIENPPQKIKLIKEGDTVSFGKEKLFILESFGHTPGSICLFNNLEKTLFSGDTIFENGIGRTDFSYSSPKEFQKNLKKIKKRFVGYETYPGHGNIFKLTNNNLDFTYL